MKYAKDIMVRNIITIDPNETLQSAARLMLDNKADYLSVIENKIFRGIITFKDLWCANGERFLKDVLTCTINSITSHTTVFEIKELMDKYGSEALPVLDDGIFAGFVLKHDVHFELGKNVDELTSLYKKDFIVYMGKKLLSLEQEVCIAFIDIDNFGCIDKTYGHVVGDRILRSFALKLLENKPESTYLCRFGGDEFVLLLPFCYEKSKYLVDRLLIQAREVRCKNCIRITATSGISAFIPQYTYPSTKDEYEEIILKLMNDASLASTLAKLQS